MPTKVAFVHGLRKKKIFRINSALKEYNLLPREEINLVLLFHFQPLYSES